MPAAITDTRCIHCSRCALAATWRIAGSGCRKVTFRAIGFRGAALEFSAIESGAVHRERRTRTTARAGSYIPVEPITLGHGRVRIELADTIALGSPSYNAFVLCPTTTPQGPPYYVTTQQTEGFNEKSVDQTQPIYEHVAQCCKYRRRLCSWPVDRSE